GIKSFSVLIMQTVFFLVLFIVVVGVVGHHALFETVLFAIALAVGLTPEFLPMITTVTLGQGALRMAKQKVIVKHLESIQNFGSIDTLCSDKTGTLTSGETKLEGFLDLSEKADAVLFHTGWFVESLATQTLVLFSIRTAGNPLRSRPSLPLTITTLLIVALGILLPYTPLAGPLGFAPLPLLYFLFLGGVMVVYLLLVELVKRRLMRRYA
ncbi:MAG TPA: HAD-IC family P-type ATPase, partial [Ktedonobacteraceae bacterium]|nr:HAD-IC family P-type ATPase [Ktedonobacteraceae bacterium]